MRPYRDSYYYEEGIMLWQCIYINDKNLVTINSVFSELLVPNYVMKTALISTCFVFRCCQECARTEGEPCGGDQGFSGTCEPGLSCQQPGLSPSVGICRPIVFDTGENT